MGIKYYEYGEKVHVFMFMRDCCGGIVKDMRTYLIAILLKYFS